MEVQKAGIIYFDIPKQAKQNKWNLVQKALRKAAQKAKKDKLPSKERLKRVGLEALKIYQSKWPTLASQIQKDDSHLTKIISLLNDEQMKPDELADKIFEGELKPFAEELLKSLNSDFARDSNCDKTQILKDNKEHLSQTLPLGIVAKEIPLEELNQIFATRSSRQRKMLETLFLEEQSNLVLAKKITKQTISLNGGQIKFRPNEKTYIIEMQNDQIIVKDKNGNPEKNKSLQITRALYTELLRRNAHSAHNQGNPNYKCLYANLCQNPEQNPLLKEQIESFAQNFSQTKLQTIYRLAALLELNFHGSLEGLINKAFFGVGKLEGDSYQNLNKAINYIDLQGLVAQQLFGDIVTPKNTHSIQYGITLTIPSYRAKKEEKINDKATKLSSANLEGSGASSNILKSPVENTNLEVKPSSDILNSSLDSFRLLERQKLANEAIKSILSFSDNKSHQEEVLNVLLEGFTAPFNLSFLHKRVFREILWLILKTFNIDTKKIFKPQELIINEKNFLLGTKETLSEDDKSLNTQALIKAALEELNTRQIQFRPDLTFTKERDLEILLNRFSCVREGIQNIKTQNSLFFTEDNNSLNYYADCSILLNSPKGRLELVRDIFTQLHYLMTSYEISNHRKKVSSLALSLSTINLFQETTEALRKNGSRTINDWINENLSSIANNSIDDDTVKTLPENVLEALMNDKKLLEFIKGEELYTKALLTALKKEAAQKAKVEEFINKFGEKQLKELLNITLNPFADHNESLFSRIQLILKQEVLAEPDKEFTEFQQNAVQLFALLPSGLIEFDENKEIKINFQAPNGKNYKIPHKTQVFLDFFIAAYKKAEQEMGYIPPEKSPNDNVVTQLNLLQQKYNLAINEIDKKIKEIRKVENNRKLSERELANIRFQQLLHLERILQIVKLRFPNALSSDLSRIPIKQKSRFQSQIARLGNESEFREIMKFMETYCGGLDLEHSLDSLTFVPPEQQSKELLIRYCSTRKLFTNFIEYLKKLAEINQQ